MDTFRNIGVIGREGRGVRETLNRLLPWLQQRCESVMLGEPVAAMTDFDLRVCSQRMIGDSCDLVIVVGGDGSLLGAARELAASGTPVLGINRGRLGFLTDISPDDVEQQIGAVLDGKYTLEKRFLLDVELHRGGEVVGIADALNDVVINSGTSAQMMEFELTIEGEFVYRLRADGLIVSTPTGSTAYSLSAGGPIMHPRLDALLISPMFPHTLTSRPIVVDGKSELKIRIGGDKPIKPPVTCDGQVELKGRVGDVIYVRKKPHKMKLIHPLEHSFYASCRQKLGWAGEPRTN